MFTFPPSIREKINSLILVLLMNKWCKLSYLYCLLSILIFVVHVCGLFLLYSFLKECPGKTLTAAVLYWLTVWNSVLQRRQFLYYTCKNSFPQTFIKEKLKVECHSSWLSCSLGPRVVDLPDLWVSVCPWGLGPLVDPGSLVLCLHLPYSHVGPVL